MAGDVTALDAGWITEERTRRPDGRDDQPEAVHRAGRRRRHELHDGGGGSGLRGGGAGGRRAPIVPFADYNVVGEPAEFAAGDGEAVRR